MTAMTNLTNMSIVHLLHYKVIMIRCAVKTIAKFHAVGICHKMMLLQAFEAQVKAAEQKKTFEDIEVEGKPVLLYTCLIFIVCLFISYINLYCEKCCGGI